MTSLVRFSVSVGKGLLDRFDAETKRGGYTARSKAIADLMRESLVRQEWKAGKEVAAAIIMVYDHHKRDLSNQLAHIGHDYHQLIISSQHVHLDSRNCLEIVVVRGSPKKVEELAGKLKASKGVKYSSVAAASTGKGL